MKCPKCNHALPADSEFCQYCGTRIEKPAAPPVMEVREEPIAVADLPVAAVEAVIEAPVAVAPKQPQPIEKAVEVTPAAEASETSALQLPDLDKMTPDEALNAILQVQAKNTVEAMEANSRTQPDNEEDADFGLVPEKPIFTLALQSVEGEREYLEKLYTVNGEKIKYNRLGSTYVDGINGAIDIYDTYLPSGQPYKIIYINMYGTERSTKAPAGFALGKPAAHPAVVPQKEGPVAAPVSQAAKPVKAKYCGKCGSDIDSKTRKCTGCGRQYFRGLRFTKFSVTVIVLALVIAALSTVSVLQFLNTQKIESASQAEIDNLESKISSLEQQVKNKESTIKIRDSTIKRLEGEIDDLEEEQWGNLAKLYFFDTYAEIVPDDGTYTYHKWDCSKLNTSYGFWIFNTAVAAADYKECSYCH